MSHISIAEHNEKASFLPFRLTIKWILVIQMSFFIIMQMPMAVRR
jgi:hypothetical protein